MKEKVYISGPITGHDRDEYMAAFARAERLLKNNGYRVANPTRHPPCRWRWLYRIMGYRLTLLYDLALLMRCDRIFLLPGWKDSHGACIESFTAYHLRIRRLPSPMKDILDRIMEYPPFGAGPLETKQTNT